MSSHEHNVYVDKSKINDSYGLFAKTKINAGEIILLIDYTIVKHDAYTNSGIYVCLDSDHLIKCNPGIIDVVQDIVKLYDKPRTLYEAFNSDEPFFDVSCSQIVNSHIVVKNKTVLLMAKIDIHPHDEIYLHKGFEYYFKMENRRGFVQDNINNDYYDQKIMGHGFFAYCRKCYPSAINIMITFNENYFEARMYDKNDIFTDHVNIPMIIINTIKI